MNNWLMQSEWLLKLAVLSLVLVEITTRFYLLRRCFHVARRFFIFVELTAHRLVRWWIPPRILVEGECHRCGVCCTQICGAPPKWMRQGWWLRLYLVFHQYFHNFHAVGRGPDGEVIFSCGHLLSNNRCGIYTERPLICRNYPVQPYFDRPHLFPMCSYRITPQVVAKMNPRASLPIINPVVAVHHPGTAINHEPSHDDYHYVEPTQ